MKQETIEGAAFNYAAQRFPNAKNKDCGIVAQEQYACRAGFMAGAEWQRNHVWHKPTEQPEESKLVLTLTSYGAFICGPNHEGWEGTVDHFKIITWAYVDDLKPTPFDEILEANKGTLKGSEE